MPGGRRRAWIVRGSIAMLAMLALVVAPGWSALRPGFLERYPAFREAHATWVGSEHAKVSCQACHVEPTAVAQGAYAARMLGEFYLSLASPEREPALFAKPVDAACESCHEDIRTLTPSGDLTIPHRAHVVVLKMDCVACHARLVHTPDVEGGGRPPMAGCLTCHDGTTAKNDCAACHTDKERPATHKAATWLVDHPAAPRAECTGCHEWKADWCADCHRKRPASHTRVWRETHGDATKQRRTCEACHEGDFCTRCHGEVPKENFDPLLKVVN